MGILEVNWRSCTITRQLVLALCTCHFGSCWSKSARKLYPTSLKQGTLARNASAPSEDVHVVFCVDRGMKGMLKAVSSVQMHCKDEKQNIVFHVVTMSDAVQRVDCALRCMAKSAPISFHTYLFDHAACFQNITFRVHNRLQRSYGLQNPLNFARFCLHKILPWQDGSFRKVLYLDTDVLAQACVGKLYNSYLNVDSKFAVAAANPGGPIGPRYVKWDSQFVKDWNAWRPFKVHRQLLDVNAGVLLIDLFNFEQQEILADVLYWIVANNKEHMYSYGSQPPLVLGLAGRMELFGKEWNQFGLGYKHVHSSIIKSAKILHWTGRRKPWTSKAMKEYQSIWTATPLPIDCELIVTDTHDH